MADYDAIIVGAGHNGLVVALCLARAGWRVLVVEQALNIGGAVQTAEITLPGFKHDLFASNLTLFTASPAYREFKSEFDLLGLRFLSNNCPFASAYADGQTARVYRNPEATELEMARFSAEDLAGWRSAVVLFKQSAPNFLPLQFTTFPSFDMVRQLGRILGDGPSGALKLARILSQTPRQFVDRYFTSPEVKGLFTPWAFHVDYGPDIRGGAIFALVSAMSAYLRGMHVAEGGAGQVIAAIRTLLEKRGGHILTATMVTKVQVSEGRAVGIETARGDVITAGKAVIANVTPRKLFGGLVSSDDLPSGFFRRIGRFRYGVGTIVVHLALDRKLEWKAAENLSDFNYIHLCGTGEEIADAYAQSTSGKIPTRPMMIVSQTSQVDPSRAPPGHHVARVHARAFPGKILGDAAGQIKGHDWDDVKEAVADRLIDLLAAQAPNVKSALLARRVVSPLDLERSNPNLVEGDCNGGSAHLDQHYFARPILGWSRYSTPIRQLYMVGASQWPGSGVNASSGYLLAKQLLR
jgi:phytoene dehydrogenase-like protein